MKYAPVIENIEKEVLELLKKGTMSKAYISITVGVPMDILNVVLKRLRDKEKVAIAPVFDKGMHLAKGSGYCLMK